MWYLYDNDREFSLRFTKFVLIILILIILLDIIFPGLRNNNKERKKQKNVQEQNSSPEIENKTTARFADSVEIINEVDTLKIERNREIAEKLKNKKLVDIISIKKNNTRFASTGEDLGDKCDNWNLEKKVLERIIKESQSITGPEWHYLYEVWPCYHEGDVIIDGKTFFYRVNAGSYIFIRSPDTTFYFGCPDKKFEKYFLSTVWDPDAEQ